MVHFLWIEDEPDTVRGFREELEELIKALGSDCEIVLVGCKNEAQSLLKDEVWDCVLLDPMIPDNPENGKAYVINRSAGAELLTEYHRVVHPKKERPFRVIAFTGLINPTRVSQLQNQLTEEDLYIEKTSTIGEFIDDVKPAMAALVSGKDSKNE